MPTVSTVYGTGGPIPYADEIIGQLQFTQSADVLFIVHPSYHPATLSRYPGNEWRYEVPQFEYGPYMPQPTGGDEISLTVDGVVDRITLTSDTTDFTGASPDDLVEYAVSTQKALGKITAVLSAYSVVIEPLEERSLVLAREVYSPGMYAGWNGTDSIPTYANPITGSGVDVAFSNSQVVTRSTIGNYLRFANKDGEYKWMLVSSVSDILEQGAYGIIAKGDILTIITTTGVVTKSPRTISGTLLASDPSFFDGAVDAGRLFRLVLGDNVVHARATSFVSGGEAVVQLSGPVPLTQEGASRVLDSTTTDWQPGAWFVGNYPATVGFHEGRLVFGGSDAEPQTAWMSKTDDYFNFASTDAQNRVQDDSAITFTMSSDTVNAILWMATHSVLLAGTKGSEWVITASAQRDAITPSNITVNQQSSYGSQFAKALTIGHSVFYTQRGGNKLREMVYDYSTDRYSSMDVTVFAEHILRKHGGAVQLAYQLLPESVIYVLCADGQIGVLTYEPDQKVYSWSRFVVGGPDAVVTSIAAKTVNSESSLYLVVARTINGETFRTIEKLVPSYEPSSPTDFTDMLFLDGYVSVPLGSIDEDLNVYGYVQFAGTAISILLDDTVYDNITVSAAGDFTIPTQPATRLIAGFNYSSVFKSFPVETQGRRGTTQAKLKTIPHVSVRVQDTIGFKHGWSASVLDTVQPLSPLAHQTDDIRVTLDNNYDTRGAYYMVQDRAYPLTILALFPELALHQ